MPKEGTTAFDHAAKLLAGRDKTRAQLAQALERKGFDAGAIADALARAGALGWLDDARVARRRAADGLRDGWAGEALLAKLVASGLEDRIAAQAIAAAIDELGWVALDAARALLGKRRLEGAKAARFLASRGFGEDVVERLVPSM